MARIEDYALIGDMQTAALVAKDGSIDWWCVPHFDSGACFAALLGTPDNGRWKIAPSSEVRSIKRRYRDESLVLETEFETGTGTVRLIDAMPPRDKDPDIVRIVEGVSGEVEMTMELVIRFDYGSIVPWVRSIDGVLRAIGGPDALSLWSPVKTEGVGLTTQAKFRVRRGERVPFVLKWHLSHVTPQAPADPVRAVEDTDAWWRDWSRKCTYQGPWRREVVRSVITLKALTFAPTGGQVAAATTSLPERVGGERNWDYRFCWLRDATFSLYALMLCGYLDEAREWRNWLLRAVAGEPSKLQTLYGAAGARRLTELELPWLAGYEQSCPVRIGNAAHTQRQIDIYGEVLDASHLARRYKLDTDPAGWRLERALLEFLEKAWLEPDEGIWEVRGPRQHFTHSKMMAWVAFDRAIKAVDRFGLEGPRNDWVRLRDQIHAEICDRAFDAKRKAFTQAYGTKLLDASLLMMPLVGFLPADDPRMVGTVAAIERELVVDGFVHRYSTSEDRNLDGLRGHEGAFLPCTFWLADNYVLQGRRDEARELFERLLGVANDVGLLAEQYDPLAKRQLGNFPQAFSHVSLINTAHNLDPEDGPAKDRHEAGRK